MGTVSYAVPFSGDALAERIIELELEREPLMTVVRAVFSRLQALTSALVGDRGFDALLARAAHLSRAHAPCTLLPKGDLAMEAAAVVEALTKAELGPEEVKTCSIAIIGKLLDLLSSFIGEDLTRRIVRREWAQALAGSHD